MDETMSNKNVEEYNPQLAMVIARCMTDINMRTHTEEKCFGQQYILQKGMKLYGEAGTKAAHNELVQLHK